ncbi:MAG: PIN domain-containing protein [Actinomycetota bacterium]|jgi:predicted nucleic acid-binding protein|nr:PIN domain-containing protein [Rubrobacter sp.]MDQ3236244.1 PIN domain-containing protein [Actinomycetota bacterium]MDQ3567447.1 PIN domain-containing protein [Actinomycetota bacterium]
MYLLDTDILSNLMKRAPADKLLARLAKEAPEAQYTSSVTLGELLYGAHRSARSASLLERIEAVITVDLRVLPFDAAAARRYGGIRAELESEGTPIGDADVRIAAIALTHGLKVVTGNERHFRRVSGLEVENWMEG